MTATEAINWLSVQLRNVRDRFEGLGTPVSSHNHARVGPGVAVVIAQDPAQGRGRPLVSTGAGRGLGVGELARALLSLGAILLPVRVDARALRP